MQPVLYEQLAVLVHTDASDETLCKRGMGRNTDHVHPLSKCSATATTADEPFRPTTATSWSSVHRIDVDGRHCAVLHSGYAGAGPL